MSSWKLKQHISDSKLSVSVLSCMYRLNAALEIANLRGDDLAAVKVMATNLLHVYEPKDRREQRGYMLYLRQENNSLLIEKHTTSKTKLVAKIYQEL